MKDPEKNYDNDSPNGAAGVTLVMETMTWNRRDENILHFGCYCGAAGAKYIFPFVESTDARLYSVDICKRRIDKAKEVYGHPKITYAVGGVSSNNYPFKGIRFEKIFTLYALQFVENYKETLKNFYNLLKPGGQLGFTVLSNSIVFMLYEKLGAKHKWAKFMPNYEKHVPEWFRQNENGKQAIQRNLDAIGFEVILLDTYLQTDKYYGLEDIVELCLWFNPFLNKIPLELVEDYKQEYRELITSHLNIQQGQVSLEDSQEILYAVVQKPVGD